MILQQPVRGQPWVPVLVMVICLKKKKKIIESHHEANTNNC